MRVLFVTNHPSDDASSRYRVYQYIPFLRRLGFTVSVHPFTTPALFQRLHSPGQWGAKAAGLMLASVRRLGTLRAASWADVTVLHREAFPFGPPVLEHALIQRSRALVYSFDDALYARFPYACGTIKRLAYGLKYGRDIGAVIRGSTAVIAGSEVLAQYARRYNPCVHVIPTVVDTDHYLPRPVPSLGSRLTIGWMGSPSTSQYLHPIQDALRRVELQYGSQVQFVFVGDPTLELPLRRLKVCRWSLKSEITELHRFDIGLMPLDESEWTNGKCAFKAVLYMAAGIPVIASPIGAATRVVHHGETGFLASTIDDWSEAMRTLIDDASLRLEMGIKGRAHVEANYSVQSTAPQLVDVLQSTARDASPRRRVKSR